MYTSDMYERISRQGSNWWMFTGTIDVRHDMCQTKFKELQTLFRVMCPKVRERNNTHDKKKYWDIVFHSEWPKYWDVLFWKWREIYRTFDIKKHWDIMFSGIGTFCSGRKKEREVSCQKAFCQLDCTISGTIFLPPHSLKMQNIYFWL